MRNMHVAALLGEADPRQANETSETTMSNAKKPWAEGKTVNERGGAFFCMQGENRGEGSWWRTAEPRGQPATGSSIIMVIFRGPSALHQQ